MITNKLDVSRLLLTKKNTHRVPLYEKEGAKVVSSLPPSHLNIVDRRLTFYGSQKDVNLSFEKNGDLYISSLKPVPSAIGITAIRAMINHQDETAIVTFPELRGSEGVLLDSNSKVKYFDYNQYKDTLSVTASDNGLLFEILLGEKREEYSFPFQFSATHLSLEKIGNEFVLKDSENKIVFSITGIYLESQGEKIEDVLSLSLQGNDCNILLNREIVDELIIQGLHLHFEMRGNVEPLISLIPYQDHNKVSLFGQERPILGTYRGKECTVKVKINARHIASEIIAQNGENFETTLSLYLSHIENASHVLKVIDQDQNILKTKQISSVDNLLSIDISSQMKLAIEELKANQVPQDIVLTIQDSSLEDYLEVYGIYDRDILHRPYIGSRFISRGEVKDSTVFLSREFGRKEEYRINLFEGSLQYEIPLCSISSNSFSIPFSLIYDSRKIERPARKGLLPGWYFNLSQRLIKEKENFEKTKGNKEVLYVDSQNNTHVLTEKWFYQNEKDEEVIVSKNNVYLSNDQKLKYQDEEGREHDVTYQVDNKEGLSYFSTSSKFNYAKKSDMKRKRNFFPLVVDDSHSFEVKEIKAGKVSLTFFTGSNISTLLSAYEVFPEYLGYTKTYFRRKEIYSYLDVFCDNNGIYHPKQASSKVVKPIVMECDLLYREGKQYVKGISSLYEAEFKDSSQHLYPVTLPVFNEKEITLLYEETIDLTSDHDIPDYYENEEIENINAQIKQVEDYLSDLHKQCGSYSSSILSLQSQLAEQMVLKNISNEAQRNGEEAQQINLSHTNDNSVYGTNTVAYINYTQRQAEKNQEYQEESYRFQIKTIKNQIEEQRKALKNLYEKIDEYRVNLQNLKEVKASYVKAQKESVQDYIYDQNGNLLGFDYDGKLIYLSDRYQNEIFLSYVDGKLVEIASENQKITLQYNKANLLDFIVDPLGRKIRFSYPSSQLLLTRIDEKGKEEEMDFTFEEENLSSVSLSSLMSLSFQWDNDKVVSIQEKSKIQQMDPYGITEGVEKILSATTMEYSSDLVKVRAVEDNTLDTYHFDYDGRVISHSYEDLDDHEKDIVSISCYEEDKTLFSLSYQKRDLIQTIPFGTSYSKVITKQIAFGTDSISLLTDREMLALSIDFSTLEINDKKNNSITISLSIEGYEKEFHFKKIPNGVLSFPFIVLNQSGTLNVQISFDRYIHESQLGNLTLYSAEANIYQYDDEEHLIKIISKEEETFFSSYDGDNPTIKETVNRFGVRKKVRVLYDSFDRVTYQEDSDGFCKEISYDEKGNVIEERSYQKNNSSLANIKKTTYDEHGNEVTISGVMRDKEGNYPQEKRNYKNTSRVISSVLYPDHQELVYGYDFNTGLLTEIASDTDGQDNTTSFTYTNNHLVKLSHHGVSFSYALDSKGRKLSIKVDEDEIVTNEYVDNYSDNRVTNGSKIISTYADDYQTATIFNKDGDPIYTENNDNDHIVYEYDQKGRLTSVNRNDIERNQTTYDSLDNTVENLYRYQDITTKETFFYDSHNRISRKEEQFLNTTTSESYLYDTKRENQINRISLNKGRVDFKYDSSGRVTSKEYSNQQHSLVKETFAYLRYGENQINLVKEHEISIGGIRKETALYEYDVRGRIIKIKNDQDETRYTYDAIGRLIREDNEALNKTILYQYDAAGNLLLKKECSYSLQEKPSVLETSSYTYQKDRLLHMNGTNITYDVMGRPISIGNHTLTYNKKGNLISYDNFSYTYGMNGIRTSKTVNNETTTYCVLKDKIFLETSNHKTILYHYAANRIIGFTYNNIEYFYERDLQGNIVRIYRKDNLAIVAEYTYDAYGNHVVSNLTEANIGDINPIRYRGYYFDVETGFYYLNSRYYNPQTARFLTPDSLSILDETKSQINGLNLYSYCRNDPVNYTDRTGHSPWTDFWNGVGNWFVDHWVELAIGAGAIAVGVITMGVGAAIGGAMFAGVMATMGTATLQSIASTVVSAAVSGLISGGISAINNGDFLGGFGDGFASGFMWGGIISGASNVLSGALTITRAMSPGFNGANVGTVRFWSPNSASNPHYGGTLVKFGKYFRLDTEPALGLHFHMALTGKMHIPVSWLIGGLIGTEW